MAYINKLSIHSKLLLITVGTTFVTLLTAMIIGHLANYVITKTEINQRARVLAGFTAQNLISPLDFLDRQAASENLASLAFENSVDRACAYDIASHLFASYSRVSSESSAQGKCPEFLKKDLLTSTKNVIQVVAPVTKSSNNHIGYITLSYSLDQAHKSLLLDIILNLIILCTVMIFVYLVANKVQRIISLPVIGLEKAARDFIEHEDFSIQVENTSNDELGSMIDAFNMMVKKMEERENIIIQGREIAESANRMKSLFLANMSHELRTPLNSIMGMTQLIEAETDISPDIQEMSNVIYKSSQNLLDIVNDILDISKIESGLFTLEQKDLDFKKLIADLLESLSPIASKNGISLTASLPDKTLPIIKGDSLRLNQILTNLVGNSIKYIQDPHDNLDKNRGSTAQQKQGFININIDFVQIDDGQIELTIEVKDNGIGIAPDKVTAIFEKFRQADETITRRFGGTGLGLAITQDLVQMMGGEIGVRSTLGLGSLFWIKVPFTTSSAAHVEDIKKNDYFSLSTPQDMHEMRFTASQGRLLVAEDVELNQRYISRLLQHLGLHDFTIVSNGERVLEAFEKEEYDLILMDCHMPQKNGYDATIQIRQLEDASKSKRIPIIAMTADAMKGADEKCFEAGMDAYIAKPLDVAHLRKVLTTWIDFEDHNPNINQNVIQNLNTDEPAATPPSETSPIDLTLIKQFMNNKTQIKHFINLFKTQSDDYLLTLAANCKGGESQLWVETVHSLKGCVLIIGATQFVEILQAAEELLVSDKAARQEKLKQITDEYQNVLEHLEQLQQRL